MTAPRDQTVKQSPRRAELNLWGPVCCAIGVVVLFAGLGGTVLGVPSALIALILGAMFVVTGIVLLTAIPRVRTKWSVDDWSSAELRRRASSLTVSGALALAGAVVYTAVGVFDIVHAHPVVLIALALACVHASLGVFSMVMAVRFRWAVRQRNETA